MLEKEIVEEAACTATFAKTFFSLAKQTNERLRVDAERIYFSSCCQCTGNNTQASISVPSILQQKTLLTLLLEILLKFDLLHHKNLQEKKIPIFCY